MKKKRYGKVRFYLFTNSYSAKTITNYLIGRYKKQKFLRAVKRLSSVMNFDDRQLERFLISDFMPSCPFERIPMKLKIYLEVEKELLKLSEEKIDEYSTALEDYQRRLLYPAIERAVGNLLENIDDDSEFQKLLEEKFKSAIRIYYKVARKYGLPTMRNIPFILSIIS